MIVYTVDDLVDHLMKKMVGMNFDICLQFNINELQHK